MYGTDGSILYSDALRPDDGTLDGDAQDTDDGILDGDEVNCSVRRVVLEVYVLKGI